MSHTVKADDFTSAGTSSLIIAKPDRVEVWDVGETGLTSRGELVTWGTVAGLATVNVAVSKRAPDSILIPRTPELTSSSLWARPTPACSLSHGRMARLW